MKKHSFRFLLHGVVLLAIQMVFVHAADARPISLEDAIQKAQNFLYSNATEQGMLSKSKQPQALKLAYEARTENDGASCFYVLNRPSSEGYVIVSADDRLPDVLGYSDCGNFDIDNLPDNLQWLLSEYRRKIEYMLSSSDVPVAADVSHRDGWEVIPPFVNSQWSQYAPYNNMCPTVNGIRTLTGCVATAMAQIMNYYQWPDTGRGSHSYEWEGQTLSMDFSQVSFDWGNMLNDYSSYGNGAAQEDAVATLMAACGISVDMDYGVGASGAVTMYVYNALRQYFDYTADYIWRETTEISDADVETLVYTEVSDGRPVLYSGRTLASGHAFVCDGYSMNGLFHINWGWGGYLDGYFLLNVLDPYNDGNGYRYDQQIIYGIRPVKKVKIDGIFYGLVNENAEAIVCPPEEGYYTGDFIIPQTVTYEGREYKINKVDEMLLNYCKDLTSMIIYPYMDEIGYGYWDSEQSPNLKTVKLYNVAKIGSWAFYGCPALTTLELPESIESIGYAAFYGCSALKKLVIPNNVKSIEGSAFYGCSSLTELIIPDNVQYLDEWAFGDCSSLTSLHLGKNLESIGYCAFSGCNALPELTIPDNVQYLGEWAFANCSSLTSLHLSSSIDTIRYYVFGGCNALTELTIPDNVKSIGGSAFRNCNVLKALHLGSELETIGDFAFGYCNELTDLTIPDKVQSIGEAAFIYGSKLQTIVIPNSVKSIGNQAFDDGYSYNVRTIISRIEDPFDLPDNPFSEMAFTRDTLRIPVGTKEKYSEREIWKNFITVIDSEPTGVSLPNIGTSEATEVGRYGLDGQHRTQSQRGINIIKMSDGTVKKVMVK